jgi:sulfite exporter TauE/SafE
MAGLLVGLLAGLAATPHCIGMCGGFAVYLASGRAAQPGRAARGTVLARQIAFHAAKTVTYAFLGALVGAFGMWVVGADWIPGGRTWLVYVAAGLTILYGILMLDLLPLPRGLPGARLIAPARRFFAGSTAGVLDHVPTSSASPVLSALALGLFAGFLPCPLTTGLLMAAAGGHSVLGGMLLLGGAGLGTIPGLLAAGFVGFAASARWRKIGMRALGVVVIAIGVLMILRRAGILAGHCA